MSNRRAIDHINKQRQEERDRRDRRERESQKKARQKREQAAKDAKREEDRRRKINKLRKNSDSSSSSSGPPAVVRGPLFPVTNFMVLHRHIIIKLTTVFAFLFAVVGVALNFDIFNGYFPDHRLLIPMVFPLIIGIATFVLYTAMIYSLNLFGLFLFLIYAARLPIIIISIAVAAYFVYPYILPT